MRKSAWNIQKQAHKLHPMNSKTTFIGSTLRLLKVLEKAAQRDFRIVEGAMTVEMAVPTKPRLFPNYRLKVGRCTRSLSGTASTG
jgi:hypothetical protein